MQHYYCKTILFSEEEKKGTRINDIGKEPSFWAKRFFFFCAGWMGGRRENLNRILFSFLTFLLPLFLLF